MFDNKCELMHELLINLIFQNVDHLSWLGLTKEISSGTSLQPFWDKQQSIRKTEEHNRIVFEKFRKML